MNFLQKKKIIICCGSGGVGKTTTAASLGIQAAQLGKKVIVLTIDPAKRLATAMGLDALDNTQRKIPVEGSGELYAMMLDTKRTFDRLIEKYARPEQKNKIFDNELYQHMSSMISGSQEYMAMEKLYEIYEEAQYDLIILDTPPTRHALDFLEAPRKMIHMTSNSLLQWFIKPGLFVSRAGFGLLHKGTEKILSVFDKLAGFSFLKELSEMLLLMTDMMGGFQKRAEKVEKLLRENSVGFLVVASPASASIQDALYFYETIENEGLPFLGFVLNRFHVDVSLPKEKSMSALSENLKSVVSGMFRDYETMAMKDHGSYDLLRKLSGKKKFVGRIPLMSRDIHDLQGLTRMGQELIKDITNE